MNAAPALRPLRVGETLDVAIKIYSRHLVTLAKIVVVVILPVQVISWLVYSSATSDLFVHNGQLYTNTPGGGGGLGAAQVVTIVLTFFAGLVANGACFKAVSDAYAGGMPNWRESLGFAFRRVGSLFWLAIVLTVLLTISFILLVLPFIWLVVAWSVALPVLLFEGSGGLGALTRSFDLVRGRWWATFGTVLVAFILLAVIQTVVTFLVGLAITALYSSDSNSVSGLFALSALGRTIGQALSTPFVAAVVTVIYYDLRVRKEGLDLELLTQRLRQPGGAPGFDVAPAPSGPAAPAPPAGGPISPGPGGVSAPPPSTPPPPPGSPPSPNPPPDTLGSS